MSRTANEIQVGDYIQSKNDSGIEVCVTAVTSGTVTVSIWDDYTCEETKQTVKKRIISGTSDTYFEAPNWTFS